MPNQTAPAQNPGNTKQVAAALPFVIASRKATRFSFTTGQVTLGTAAVPISPIQLPAVGYLQSITLEVTIASTAGTAFGADGPWNVIQSIEFRTAAGNDIMVPLTGYMLYLINKFLHPTVMSPWSDPKYNPQYSVTAGTAAHFMLDIPMELDAETGLGAIPAIASNRSYQLVFIVAPYSVITGATAGNITINGTANYWTEPPAQSASGLAQATQPDGLGTINQFQLETPPITPGDKYIKLNNVGNILRGIIFVLRNSSGVRIGASTDWPAVSEIYLDNEPLFYLTYNDWRFRMARWFGLASSTADAANGLDTGVFVLPFDAMVGSTSGDPANSRSQYLPTLDASQLQLRGTSFGANVSTLEVITNSVVPTRSSDIYNK